MIEAPSPETRAVVRDGLREIIAIVFIALNAGIFVAHITNTGVELSQLELLGVTTVFFVSVISSGILVFGHAFKRALELWRDLSG